MKKRFFYIAREPGQITTLFEDSENGRNVLASNFLVIYRAFVDMTPKDFNAKLKEKCIKKLDVKFVNSILKVFDLRLYETTIEIGDSKEMKG